MASQIVADVSGSELKRHLNEIAQYVRLSGTADEAKAFDYIESQLNAFGYKVTRYASDALIGYPGKSSLEITSPDRQAIPCNGYSLSPLTGDDGVIGELVYVGSGKAADYAGLDVRGKIVISDGLAMPDKTLASQTCRCARPDPHQRRPTSTRCASRRSGARRSLRPPVCCRRSRQWP